MAGRRTLLEIRARLEIYLLLGSTVLAGILGLLLRVDRLFQQADTRLVAALLPACAVAIIGSAAVTLRRRREAGRLLAQMAQAEREIHHLTNYDPLTGLPNRSLCLDRLQRALAKAQRDDRLLAVMLLDLDGLQTVNDSFGPTTGDRLLAAAAERFAPFVRQSDTFGRMTGDEFLFLLDSVHQESDAATFARRLQEVLTPPILLGGHSFSCSASIGIAIHPWDGKEAEDLLRSATVALGIAKNRGKGRLQFCGNRLNLQARKRFQLETGLREALQLEQFILHYQPQVSLIDGRIAGAEALIRWQHPVRGLISPGKFIPVAEECGLIEEIGGWVLREACRQARMWRLLGFEQLTVGVNISAQQFTSGDFPRLVERVLHEHRLAPDALEIELTESMLVGDFKRAQGVLVRLSDLGVTLALDDFGTGFSSLRYLQSLHFHRLKIDQSFISTMMRDPNGQKIVLATIALARELGMQVIAEGVETWEQLQFLRDHGCQSFQGFIFSPGIPAGQLTRQLQAGTPLDLQFPFALGEPAPEDFGFDPTPQPPPG